MDQAYLVKIDSFEGPLDLLLHLIHQYKIDIYDIPVAEVTEQYMNYIQTMKYLELNIASEYLVMASTLLMIKSQMLLPRQEIVEEEEPYEEDPREELVQRLIKYRKFKAAAYHLEEIESESQQIYMRSPIDFDEYTPQSITEQGDVNVYDMIHAIRQMMRRKKWDEPMETSVHKIEIPIEQRMEEILKHVKSVRTGVLFDHLFTQPSRANIVTTFMALLELMNENLVRCKQKEHFGNLYVYYRSS